MIDNADELSLWASGKEHWDVVTVATRGALRSLPGIEGVLTSENALHQRLTLLTLRYLLFCGCFSLGKIGYTEGVPVNDEHAVHWFGSIHDDNFDGLTTSYSTALCACSTALYDIGSYPFFAGAIEVAGMLGFMKKNNSPSPEDPAGLVGSLVSEYAFWRAASFDCELFSNGDVVSAVFSSPLWAVAAETQMAVASHTLVAAFSEMGKSWSFWRDWYQGFLDGTPLDWNLQREVALIPDADWDKGPEHIAGKIERIRKKYDLEQEIAALKDMLRLSAINEKPVGRLHNHPPEAIDDEIALGKEITLVWEQLDQLEEEIAKPEPSPKLLNKIAQALWDASKRIMAYCGSLADVALKKAAEELGRTGTKWAIRIGVGGVAAQSEGVQSVAKAVEEFVKTLLQ